MSVVKTSPRGFLQALVPLIFLQAVLFAMALLASQTEPPMIALPTPDRAFGLLTMRIALDAVGLVIGHFALRGLGIASRSGYAAMGGLAAATGYAVALHYGLMLMPPSDGATVTAAGLPVMAGMAAGFLYVQLAGRVAIAATPSASTAAAAEAAPPPTAFDGPVQVRTSLGAMALAAFVPAFLIALLTFMLTYAFVGGSVTEPTRLDWSRQILALAMPAQMFLTMALVTVPAAMLVVALAHAAARALQRTRSLDYVATGAVAGLLMGILLIPVGGWTAFVFLFLPLVGCGAIMMTVYRRFAGLEPRALPEPVLARNLETLVPEDHPSRHAHAVVLNG